MKRNISKQTFEKDYLTPQGWERLQKELQDLLYKERPQLVKTVEWAASNGDRSENADYQYGKRRLRQMDSRIRYLTKRLESSQKIDPGNQPQDQIYFGAFVKYEEEDGTSKTIRIVGQDEIDPKKGWISWKSPLGRAILNQKVGSVVEYQSPGGKKEIEILEIHY